VVEGDALEGHQLVPNKTVQIKEAPTLGRLEREFDSLGRGWGVAMLFDQRDERGRLVGRAWGRRRLAAARGEQQGQHEQDGSNAD
jgi:hypothetical protein